MNDNSIKAFEDLQCWQVCPKVRIFIANEDYNKGREKISTAMALLNGCISYLNGRVKDND